MIPFSTEIAEDFDILSYVRSRIAQSLIRRMEQNEAMLRFREAWRDADDMERTEFGALIQWDELGVEEVTYEEPTVWFGRGIR